MNVLLVHPGPLMYTKIYLRLEPLGLELIAAAAQALGHNVTLIDLQVESHTDYVRLLRERRPDAVGSARWRGNLVPGRRAHQRSRRAGHR